MNLKRLSMWIEAVLVVGLVGHFLTGTAHAQAKDNSGNPAILEAVQKVEDAVVGLQTTLNTLQGNVDALGASISGTPSWGQTLPAARRFVVLSNMSNDAVLDRETGLVWQRTPQSGATTWDSALLGCSFTEIGGRNGWRLPTLPELASLRDPASTLDQLLPAGNPFVAVPTGSNPGGYFWTATHSDVAVGPFPGNSYLVLSFDKTAQEYTRARTPDRSDTFHWCVRGPTNHSID